MMFTHRKDGLPEQIGTIDARFIRQAMLARHHELYRFAKQRCNFEFAGQNWFGRQNQIVRGVF